MSGDSGSGVGTTAHPAHLLTGPSKKPLPLFPDGPDPRLARVAPPFGLSGGRVTTGSTFCPQSNPVGSAHPAAP